MNGTSSTGSHRRSDTTESPRGGVNTGPRDAARRLTIALLVLMAAQSISGLVYAERYRDVAWIKATWFGNDWTTIALVAPLIGVAVARQRRGSSRWLLVWAGTVAYAVYNYSFYLFGAALSVFFPVYIAAVALAALILTLLLGRADVAAIAQRFRRNTPVRAIGGYFVFVGVGLASVWIVMWGAYVFAGRPTPVEPEAFKVVAALDLSLMVPAFIGGGLLLWKRRPWGYVLASITGIQAALYLTVLSVNSIVAIRRGLTAAPGELPIWVPLAMTTSAATLLLLANLRDRDGPN